MAQFIDIHTHKTHLTSETIAIKNILLPDEEIKQPGIYSLGWHPWHIQSHTIYEISETLKQRISHKHVVAIGECGIDRAISTSITIQKSVFKIHIELAQESNKPLIIHAVRSYSDILQTFKELHPTLKIIFHDYHGNPHQTQELLKYNSYFSFGQNLLKEKQKTVANFRAIPLNRIFLETDESDISIQNIYIRAANLIGTKSDLLKLQIKKNFIDVFGDGLVK